MEKLKICQLIDTYYPVVDGAINVAKFYAHHTNQKENCILAVPKASKKYTDNETFEVVRCFSMSAPESYRCGVPELDAKFKSRMEQEGFDILHTHSPYLMGRYAVKLGKKYKIPVVATLHTQYHQDFERVMHNSKTLVNVAINYIMKVYNKADSVWTVSNRSCEVLRSYGYKGKIEVIRNGTDFVYPENAEELIKRVNDAHGLEGQKNVFLFVGRMCWYKNLKIIIDALNIVKKTNDDFKMVFVGGGFDIDDVKKYVEEVGLSDKCIFTGPIKDKPLLQGYYLRADLLLFPSTFDMAPVTAVEAAAHKLCALMVEGSCSAELLQDGVNGFLAEENAESFSAKIIEIMKTPELYRKIGDVAGATLYRSWEMVAEEVVEKYREVIAAYKRKQKALERLKVYRRLKRKQLKEQAAKEAK